MSKRFNLSKKALKSPNQGVILARTTTTIIIVINLDTTLLSSQPILSFIEIKQERIRLVRTKSLIPFLDLRLLWLMLRDTLQSTCAELEDRTLRTSPKLLEILRKPSLQKNWKTLQHKGLNLLQEVDFRTIELGCHKILRIKQLECRTRRKML